MYVCSDNTFSKMFTTVSIITYIVLNCLAKFLLTR